MKNNQKRIQYIFISFLISLLWILAIYWTCGIYFETNDDRMFTEIFSGAMTGAPEWRAYYIHPLMGLLMAGCYMITKAIPWYGLLLISMQWVCHGVFTYSVLKIALNTYKRRHWALVVAVASLGVYYAICFTLIANIQFTSTASLLAVTGYVVVLSETFMMPCDEENWKRTYLSFAILELLSYQLRSDSMLMIQIMGMPVILAVLLVKEWKISRWKAFLQNTLWIPVFIVLPIVLICKVTSMMVYSSEGWKEYEKINQGVTEITDYSVIPAYEEVKDILDRYEVSEKQYNAFFQYAMIQRNLSGDCLLELAERGKAHYIAPNMKGIIEGIRESFSDKQFYRVNTLTVCLWAILIISILLTRGYDMILPSLGLLGCRTVLWMYLFYRGRTPFRVMYPLWVMESLVLLCMTIGVLYSNRKCGEYSEGEKEAEVVVSLASPAAQMAKIGIAIGTVMLLVLSVLILKKQFIILHEKNQGDAIYNTGYSEIIAYCDAHPQERYFIDSNVLQYYRGSALQTRPFHPRNCYITGNWYSGAPVFYDAIEKHAPEGEGVLLITSVELQTQAKDVIEYFEEWRGSTGELIDTFMVSNGGTYEVHRF